MKIATSPWEAAARDSRQLRGDYRKRNRSSRDIEVQEIGGESGIKASDHSRDGNRDQAGDNSQRQRKRQIHRRDLARLRADCFHHADLANLACKHRRHEVDDEKATQQESEKSEGALRVEKRVDLGCMDVPSRDRNVYVLHGTTSAFDCHFHFARDAANPRMAERGKVDLPRRLHGGQAVGGFSTPGPTSLPFATTLAMTLATALVAITVIGSYSRNSCVNRR